VYRWNESGTEAELEIEDESTEAVFREGVVALGDILTEQRGGEPLVHGLSLSADDVSSLFEGWLSELARLDREESFVCERVVRLDLAGTTLEGAVAGQRFEHEPVVEALTGATLKRDETDAVFRGTAQLRLTGRGR
jgi:SHS2 domain-containing protein